MKATAAVDSEHHHAAHPPPPISPTTALAPDRSMDQANPSVTKADQMQMDTTALGSCLPSPSQSTSSFTSSKSLPVVSKEDDVVASDDLDSLQIPLPLSHAPPTPTLTQDLEPGRPSLIQPHLTQVSEVLVSSPKMNPSKMRVTKTTEETPAERKHWSLDQFEMMRAKDHKDKATTHFSPSPTSSSGSVLTSGVSPVTRSHIRQAFDGVSGPRTGSGSGTRIARASSIHEGHLHPNFHQLSQPEQQQQQQLHSYPQHPHPAHNRKSSLPPPLITNLPALPSPVQTTASMGTATNGIPFSNVPLGLSTPYTDVFQYTTSSSSSGNYYACPWILPPIPSFTELGIRFDRSRTTSLNAIANDSNIVPIQTRSIANSGDLSTTGMRINVDGQGYHWSRKAQPTHLSEPETIPDYLPSIFDYIQSDDNEDIILWSTSHNPGPSSLPHPPTPGGSRIHPSNNSVPPSPSSTGVYPSNSQSVDRSVRRWSVGDTFKGKDKDTDNDSRTSNELGKVAVSNQSTDTLPQQKPTRRPTGISGGVSGPSDRPDPSSERKPVSTTSVTSPSQRVIMAATVEKLVEKLTSEIDYTFLTDFFLIYRLFITPMALLKLLIARFQWALAVNSPQRQIVRVRTFVTLRHWLLNYFGYDFMRSKVLRQTLTKNLAKLKEHPLVVDSTRDQRIIRELGRYTQSLKKLHYRNMAQQKLSRQNQKKRREDRTMTPTHLSSPVEWTDVPESGGARTRPSSSNRSSSVAYGVLRKSILSEVTTEELTVEFRSSDQSDDSEGDSELDDSSDDGFEPSSENSQYEDGYDSQYTASGDDHQEGYSSGEDNNHLDQQDYSPEGSHYPTYSNNPSECHLPSPAFSPRSLRSPLAQGSFHPLVGSAVSSTASRTQARGIRPAIPDFQEEHSAPDNFSQSYRHSMTGRRASHAKTYPRPLSMVLPPDMSIPPSHGSMRSIEPYMNPPPRSIASTEKKNTWSKYMSATVGRLSKMKRVFSKKGHRHTNSSTSTHSLGSGKGTSSMVNQRGLVRRQGNQSDPEGEKLSHYLLGSCTGMNLVSSSDDHRLSIDRKYTAERDQRGSGGSSDEEFSQYEMTQHQMMSNEFDQDALYKPGHPLEISEDLHAMHEAQERHLEYDHGDNAVCSECEREQCTPSIQDQGENEGDDHDNDDELEAEAEAEAEPDPELEPAEEGGDYADEQREGAQGMQASMGTRRVPNLRRTNLKKDRNHRASWMTFSSANSSVFGAILSEDHLSPRQVIDRNRHGNVDRFVERYAQQPSPLASPGENTISSRRKSVDLATATPPRRRASWILVNSSVDKQGPSGEASELGDKDASTSRSYNPKRQTTPIVFLHHHYHHHLSDDKPIRRHSYDVQSMEGWKGFQNALHQNTGENKARPSISKAPNSSLAPNKGVQSLLEGALMAHDPSGSIDFKTDPPRTPSRASHAHTLSQPMPTISPVRPNISQARSNSQPHLLFMSDPEYPTPDHPLQCRHRQVPQRPGLGTSTSFTGRYSSYRFQGTHPLDVHFSPSIPHRPTRVPPLVLRYRSELIAQQLCLIEREMLSQIQWYELVDAGTKNKAAAAAKTEAAEKRNESVMEGDVMVGGVSAEGEHGDRSEGTATPTPLVLAGKLSQRSPIRTKEDNDGIKRLVDRFNVTCQWVSSDILKTQDLDMRVKVVEKFIRIAKTCYNHSNFSSLMQIMLALQSTPVSRLYRTWDRVRTQEATIFADLVEFTSPFHNWRHLRETMKNIADDWGGAGSGDGGSGSTGGSPPATSPTTEKQTVSFFNRRASKAKALEGVEHQHLQSSMAVSQPPLLAGHRKMSSSPMLPSMVSSVGRNKEKEKPQKLVVQQGGCIPFLGLYLSDLVFNTEIPSYVEPRSNNSANPMSGQELVNIHKHRTTATIIKRILTFRTIAARYPFREEAGVHGLLMSIEGMDPSELQRLSHQLEERMV